MRTSALRKVLTRLSKRIFFGFCNWVQYIFSIELGLTNDDYVNLHHNHVDLIPSKSHFEPIFPRILIVLDSGHTKERFLILSKPSWHLLRTMGNPYCWKISLDPQSSAFQACPQKPRIRERLKTPSRLLFGLKWLLLLHDICLHWNQEHSKRFRLVWHYNLYIQRHRLLRICVRSWLVFLFFIFSYPETQKATFASLCNHLSLSHAKQSERLLWNLHDSTKLFQPIFMDILVIVILTKQKYLSTFFQFSAAYPKAAHAQVSYKRPGSGSFHILFLTKKGIPLGAFLYKLLFAL